MDMIPNGTKVLVTSSGTALDGHTVTVCGVASMSKPVVGYTYIVDFPDHLRNESYDYTHAVLFECYLEIIKTD